MGNSSKVIPINFDASKIHLDCVFNTLDKDSAVISPYVYDRRIIEEHISNLYEISKECLEEAYDDVKSNDPKFSITLPTYQLLACV